MTHNDNLPHDSQPKRPFNWGLLFTVLLVAGTVSAVVAYRWYFDPVKVWRRSLAVSTDQRALWAEVERERRIEGLDARQTAVEVLSAMSDTRPEVRILAASCAPALEIDPLVLIAHLTERVHDKESKVRAKAAEALGQVYKRGKPGRTESVAALREAMGDEDAQVRKVAIGSMGQVIFESGRGQEILRSGNVSDPALDLVEARLKSDADQSVRVEAAFVLGCNDRGVEAVPFLTRLVEDQPRDQPPSHLVNRAFTTLSILAVRSQEAVDFLYAQLVEEREDYPDRPRDALAWAAREGSNAHAMVRKRARQGLKSDNPLLRVQSAFLLHDIGQGIEALDVLAEAVKQGPLESRIRAVEALTEIGEADDRAMEALHAATNDDDIEVRVRALGALEAIELQKMQ